MHSINANDKPRKPSLRPIRLLDQVRERLRYLHYSLRTEKSYVYWARWYIRFHGLRHPIDMGAPKIQAFMSYLVNERNVAAATHTQALSALLFLYKKLLKIKLPWIDGISRPKKPARCPTSMA